MNILFVIGQFHPYVGGAEAQAGRLARALVKKGASVTVLTSRLRGTAAFEEIEGVRVHRLWAPGFGRVKMLALCVRMYWEALKLGRKADVLHLHQGSYPSVAGVFAACHLKKPCIVKMGSAGETRFDLDVLKQSFPLGIGRRMAGAIVSSATRFVALNTQVEQDLERWGVEERRRLFIPNGVEIPERAWTPDTRFFRKKLNLPVELPGFLCVGNLLERKNHALVLEALLVLKNQGLRANLVVLGEGLHRKTLEEKAESWGIRDQVSFEGTVANVDDYLYAGDGFILPSVTEGMSNALLEAMAVGIPCLVSDVPGNRAVLRDGESGVVFPLGNPEGLAEKMRTLLEQPQVAFRMGQSARREMKERFAVNRVAEQYLQLYESLLK